MGKNIVANILRVRAFTGLFWKRGRCEVAVGSDTSFTQKPLPIQASSETSRSSVRNKNSKNALHLRIEVKSRLISNMTYVMDKRVFAKGNI